MPSVVLVTNAILFVLARFIGFSCASDRLLGVSSAHEVHPG